MVNFIYGEDINQNMDLKLGGCNVIDILIGGIESGIITTIYGPPGTGKSNICLLLASKIAQEKKIIYIDTEGGFSIERLKQINSNYGEILDKIIILKPTNFAEQRKAIRLLKEMVDNDIGMIIVDTFTMLYRVELGSQEELYSSNKELGKQLVLLNEVARKKNIPILITNQVYADFNNPGSVNMVGGELMKYGCKCILEIKKGRNSYRSLCVKKHRSVQEEKEIKFKITNSGFEMVDPLHL